MRAKNIKLVFFGTGQFSLPVLTGLHEAGYQLAAVVTKPDAARGRGQKILPAPVAQQADRLGIQVLKPRKASSIDSQLESLGADAGVVAAYGKLLPPSTLGIFPAGLVNIHPSLLPKYRGPSPVATAILDGVKQTGVTIMEVIEAMDAGGIYDQQSVPLSGSETTLGLTTQLFALGTDRLTSSLPGIIEGKIKPRGQDDARATYTKLFNKDNAHLNWQEPAVTNERKVRAFTGWFDPHAAVGSMDIVVSQASVVKKMGQPGELFIAGDNQLGVYCAKDALLLETVTPPGKSAMPSADFLAGHRQKLDLK